MIGVTTISDQEILKFSTERNGITDPSTESNRAESGENKLYSALEIKKSSVHGEWEEYKAAEQEEATAISNRFVKCSVEVHRYYKIIFSTCLYIYIIP